MTEHILMRLESGGCDLCNIAPGRQTTVIAGSVGRGGRNVAADVETIQSALNATAPADGGPIDKLDVDGLVGQLTIAAIERYQNARLGWADGRVDPDGPTIHMLVPDQVTTAHKGSHKAPNLPKATPAQNKAFIEKIGGLLPRARHFVEMAQLKIDMASDFLRRAPVDPNDPFPVLHDIGKPDFELFDKYFHFAKHSRSVQLKQLHHVRRIYDQMQTVLTESLLQAPMFGWGVGYFQPDPADGTLASKGYVAYTFYGGWQRRRKDGRPRLSGDDNYEGDRKLRQDTIFFPVGKMLTRSDNYLLVTILHELAHFVGPGGPLNGERIGDYTYDSKPNFLKVNNWTALHTAESYGYFATEAALRKVTIPIA
jgi:hypothetical protein